MVIDIFVPTANGLYSSGIQTPKRTRINMNRHLFVLTYGSRTLQSNCETVTSKGPPLLHHYSLRRNDLRQFFGRVTPEGIQLTLPFGGLAMQIRSLPFDFEKLFGIARSLVHDQLWLWPGKELLASSSDEDEEFWGPRGSKLETRSSVNGKEELKLRVLEIFHPCNILCSSLEDKVFPSNHTFVVRLTSRSRVNVQQSNVALVRKRLCFYRIWQKVQQAKS